jgi:putative aldouronate transport system substrate-binding protein
MSKTKITKTFVFILALVLLSVSIIGCSPSVSTGGSTTGSGQLEHMAVNLFLWGDRPNQMAEVLAKFEELTKDTLNMSISINWTPQGDYPNNIKLKLSAGQEVDMCFDAPWMNMNTFILQGNYRDLTAYFLNPEYPGLESAFNVSYLSNNLMGENGDKVYGVPLAQSFGGSGMVFLRGDLREKYEVDPVTDQASFEAYLQAIVDNEPSMIPFVMKKDNSYGASSIIDVQDPEKAISQIEAGLWDAELAPGITATLYIKDYEIIECVISGEPNAAYANFPAPYNQADYSVQKKVREWYEKGYIEKDVITRDDAQGTFSAGKGASFFWDAAQYNLVLSALTQSVAGSKLEIWDPDPLSANDIMGMKKGSYTAWNFICIPVTTADAKADRIMMFFDWMFANTENHDLIEWGIEGKNYISIGDDQYTYPEGLDLTTNYNFPGYQLSWNPNFIRYPQGYPEDVLHVMKAANNTEAYYNPLLSGFRFNGDPVKNQLANPDFLTAKSRTDNLALGIFADVIAENAAIDAMMSGNKFLQEDIAAIKAEVIKQAEVYLAERKISDQKNEIKYPTVADLKSQIG